MNRAIAIALTVIALLTITIPTALSRSAPVTPADLVGAQVDSLLPEFFDLAGAICPNGEPARVPSDERFLTDLPVTTPNGTLFESPHDFQQAWQATLDAGLANVTISDDGRVEDVLLDDSQVYRTTTESACATFGTEGSLFDAVGMIAWIGYMALPEGPAVEIPPPGILDQ